MTGKGVSSEKGVAIACSSLSKEVTWPNRRGKKPSFGIERMKMNSARRGLAG